MALTNPVVLSALLLFGAVAIPRIPRLDWPLRQMLVLWLAVLGLLATLAFAAVPSFMQIISAWQNFAGPAHVLSLEKTADGVRLGVLAFLAVVGILTAGLDETHETPFSEHITVVPAIAVTLLLFGLSGNLLTLLFAWTLLDLLALMALGFPGRSNWTLMAGILQGVGLFLLLIATLRTWTSSTTLAFFAVTTDALTLHILLAAMAVRMSLYPLHLFAWPQMHVPPHTRALLPLLTLGAGGFWWLVFGASLETLSYAWLVYFLLGIGLVASGLLFWRARRPALRTATLTVWLGHLLALAVFFNIPTLAHAILWNGTLAAAVIAFHGGSRPWRQPSTLALGMAILALSGLPGGALGEVGRLLATLTTQGHDWLAGAVVVGMSMLFAGMLALLRRMYAHAEEAADAASANETEEEEAPSAHTPDRTWLGLMVLGLAAWPVVGGVLGLAPPASATSAFPWGMHIATLGLAWLAAFFFIRLETSVLGLSAWLNALAATLSARWLWQGVGALGLLLMRATRGLLRVLEGENYGWLLLFLVIILILLS
ncbi:hypothetical protein ARMA_1527 [Ardenticatena maritima]|uniref:Uncharacterized protein n=1 Tax=Ardenticatena maritima TaxID=872965 RepID=A0A0M9UCM4_9CHLR|nr:hypothetical protein [Ardenticatena maritima]KPL87810.1 hypothetical protein SE16_09620 [Ardenticatena maritima]GAP63104.1 hypothetical protein ARMA_1527 [Ardenticatena maritima]